MKNSFTYYHTETKRDGKGPVSYRRSSRGYRAVFVRDDAETSRFDIPRNSSLRDFKSWLESVSTRGCGAVKVTGRAGRYEVV